MAEFRGLTFTDLQSALDASESGETIWLCPGRWSHTDNDTAHLAGHEITLKGATGNRDDVVLDGEDVGALLLRWQCGGVSLKDFTLEHFVIGHSVPGTAQAL